MRKIHIFIPIILVLSILISYMPSALAQGEIIDFEEELSTISDEEKRIIEELFIQLQEIEGLERDYENTSKDIEGLKSDVKDLEFQIQEEEEKYDYNLSILEELLKSYQRMGPASYLEIVLESQSVSDFLRRINVIRDLTKNTGDLLKSVEETKEKLLVEKSNLDEKLALIEERQRNLQEILSQKTQLVREQEEYLKSLESDREYYQMHLENLSVSMLGLKELFTKLKAQLPGIIASSDISLEELNPKLSLQGIRLTISEDLFNRIIGEHEDLPIIRYEFSSKNINMFIDEYKLRLTGDFSIYQGHSIEFIIKQVRFYDFILEEKTVKDLMGDSILFEFERILEGSSIKDIKIFDGYIELTLDLKLFSWRNQND